MKLFGKQSLENLMVLRHKLHSLDPTGEILDGDPDIGADRLSHAKSAKKQHKNSAVPKAVNAFQRVKVDEVDYVDERLQDNSYRAKGGAESGYGAKAQEILGQVKRKIQGH